MPLLYPLFLFLLVASFAMVASSRTKERDPREADQISQLSERVRALEAIITDRDRQLRDDIDRLR